MPAVVVRRALGAGAARLDARVIRRRAERMLAELALESRELGVLLTDDANVEALNRRFRRKAKPTDVLAFPMDGSGKGPSGEGGLLGDVVISVDTARRQARDRRHDLLAEVTHLLAHGLLHLVGYDHRTDAEERRMDAALTLLVGAATRRKRRSKTSSAPSEMRGNAARSLNK